MLEPKPISPRRPGTTRYPEFLAIAVALATVVSPTVAMARGKAVGILGAVGAVMAPPAASGPLRVDVEPTIDDATLLHDWVVSRNPSVAEKVPAIEGHEQWIAVKIGGETYDYRVSVVAMRDGKPLGAVKEAEVCECTNEKLLELVDARIATSAEAFRASAPEPAPEPEPDPDTTKQPPAPDPYGSKGDKERWRPDTMGYVGIGLGVLGVGLLAGGIPLALRKDELRGDAGSLSLYTTRLPGIGMAVGGGVALVGGIALVVVDVLRHRKSKMAVLPTFGPREAGVFVVRRF